MKKILLGTASIDLLTLSACGEADEAKENKFKRNKRLLLNRLKKLL